MSDQNSRWKKVFMKEEKIVVRNGRLVRMTVLTEWEVDEKEESARPIKKSVVFDEF